MKVLLADDDRMTRRLMEKRLVAWGYEVVTAEDGEAAWSLLQDDDSPRLLLLDWMMPGMDGIDLCRRIREVDDAPYRYIIMLTGKGEKEDVVTGLEAGADDYLTKPVVMDELKVRLRTGQRILDLHSELLQAQDQLRYQATHDALTGLWNRRAVLDALVRETARSGREQTSLAVVLVDVDHFKRVNDTYGHTAGDTVLREAAKRLEGAKRVYDSVGRYGGEEFLFILPGCDVEKAQLQAERVRTQFDGIPIAVGELRLPVTISLGVAAWSAPSPGLSGPALLERADAALYQAKDSGRNRVCVARESRPEEG